jgi:ACS family hexuronate transporter-like MFS transporter
MLCAVPPEKVIRQPSVRSGRTIPHLRWWICGLLFFATTINYIDRQVLGILKPELKNKLGWDEEQYGYIVFAFQLSYAIMQPLAGRFIDWLGTRLSYLWAVIVWSIAAMGHALANNAMQFSIARFALGFGEAANFPAAIKTVTDWFPAKERALATGIFNSGSNVGAIIAPLVVPWIAINWGWRMAFIITGAIGFTWVIAWLMLFRQPREHPNLGAQELALIEKDHEPESAVKVPFSTLIRMRQAWAFLIGKFMTDPIWWFYLYWLPGFLYDNYKLNLTQLGPPLIAVYLAADVGSVGGGWISSTLIARGWTLNAARKFAMLVCATAVTSAIFVMWAGSNMWLAVTLVSIAAAAHQGWSANMFTLASDIFPRKWIGSVVGLGGMAGAFGGMLFAPAVGKWLKFSDGMYGPVFVLCGSIYLVALLVVHLLVPKIDEMKVRG